MATFLLVHGAWHGAWCWEKIEPLLREAGHKTVAPDLLGMGKDPTPLSEVSVEAWAEQVAELARLQVEPPILVGHSRAGIVVSRAAELAPGAIACLVYLAAFLPTPGVSLAELMRRIPPRPESEGSLQLSEDGSLSSIAPDAVRRIFYNDTPDPLVARAAQLSGPEPMASFTSPARTSWERWGKIPRYYIECTKDRAIAPRLQEIMYSEAPCRRVFSLSSDHSPFYSAPGELAACLLDVAADVSAGLGAEA
jgi:pimeloyl-ACP methyl ester carboxylesterase